MPKGYRRWRVVGCCCEKYLLSVEGGGVQYTARASAAANDDRCRLALLDSDAATRCYSCWVLVRVTVGCLATDIQLLLDVS